MAIHSRLLIALTIVVAMVVPMGGAAHADKRVALVIGNSSYVDIPRLTNPAHDANLMAETLKGLGFNLVGDAPQIDLDKVGFDSALQKFGNQVLGAEVALFYYAGHGLQVGGRNFLVPVNANPTKEADVYLQMVDTSVVLSQMEGSGTRLNIVILDACRNNPFGGRGLRATTGGLAQMQAPEGTLISYATQPGNIAQDGTTGNSPYTTALAQTMRRPGLDIFRLFNEVGLAVASATGGAQQPWVSLSPIRGDFYFAGSSSSTAGPPPPGSEATPQQDQAAQAWAVTQNTTSIAVLERFIAQFNGTIYADLARARLEELQRTASKTPPNQAPNTPPRAIDPRCATESRYKSVEGKQPITVTFLNQSGSPLRLYWLDYGGHRKLYSTIMQGETHTQPTFLTHPWVIADLADKCVAVYLPDQRQSQLTIR